MIPEAKYIFAKASAEVSAKVKSGICLHLQIYRVIM